MRRICQPACKNTRRLLSSASSAPKAPGVEKTKNFFYEHRQAVINTIGVAFVFYYSIHNQKVKTAWDEREVEFRAIQTELDTIKSNLNDDEWLSRVENNVKKGDSSLKVEISKIIKSNQMSNPSDEKFKPDINKSQGDSEISAAGIEGVLTSGKPGMM